MQLIFNFEQCPCITQRFIFKVIFNMYTKRLSSHRRISRAVTKVIHNGPSQMAYCNNDVLESLLFKALNFPFQHGNAFNFYHRFWNVTRHGSNTSSLSSCHNHYFHIFSPSVYNLRVYTCRIAHRNRRLDHHNGIRVIFHDQLDYSLNRRRIKVLGLAVIVSGLKMRRRSCSTGAQKAHLLRYVATYSIFEHKKRSCRLWMNRPPQTPFGVKCSLFSE